MFNSLPFSIAALAALLPLLANAQIARTSPEYNYEFQFPLPSMPVKTPITSHTNATTGVTTDFYEVKMQPVTKRLFPNLEDASLLGYDGVVPGPTFRIPKDRETVVRFVNEFTRNASVHLHGSYSRAPFDGWAEDIIQPGEYKDYYYPNSQTARTLWYHDHAMGITSINTYAGLAGMYIIDDAARDAALGLPRGDYEIPLILNSHRFTATGNITDESTQVESVFGDTFSVNGQILPYLVVEPRKYRFRILNAAASRTFNATLRAGNPTTNKSFHVIGSDAGLTSIPVETESLVLAMSERWEIVIDFANVIGQNVTMYQTNCFADTSYIGSDKIMQFRVGTTVSSDDGNGALPATLVDLDLPTNHDTIDQVFTFGRAGPATSPWTINGVSFSDVTNRILRNVPRGTTEKWELRGGASHHPVHIHLIEFQIINRTATSTNGRTGVTPYEAVALKDVASMGSNEIVTVLAKYVPWDGIYMFHCHNTIHEDHDMMAAFNVSALPDFGYPESSTNLEDPMDARFRAAAYTESSIEEIQAKLAFFSSLSAYNDVDGILDALDEYHANRTQS